jgi:hypothetical protein
VPRAPLSSALLLFFWSVTGCGSRYFTLPDVPEGPVPIGKIAFELRDHRPIGRGGDDPRLVGVGLGFAGLPAPVRLASPTEAREAVAQLLSETLRASGFVPLDVSRRPGPRIKLTAELQALWCSGSGIAFRAVADVQISILDAAVDSGPLALRTLHAEATASDCQSAYRQTLTRLQSMAAALFNTDEVKQLLLGPSGSIPTP